MARHRIEQTLSTFLSHSANRQVLPRFVVTLFVLFTPFASVANDSAASVAAGGVVLKHEARISMEKEHLSISEKEIVVEYEFLNETDQDILTEVAFPIPPYQFYFDDPSGPPHFDDFRLWVDGIEVKYAPEIKAKNNGTDYTETLRKLGVDIGSFGHFDFKDPSAEKSGLTALSPDKQQQ